MWGWIILALFIAFFFWIIERAIKEAKTGAYK
ncbi:hypothetical protein LCGC14_2143940 [marine sediment metagenome]|uniref:Uncharacterized protein n=1 Tax=marine sediment metagenome TaxID=412755 RepID=A0A0F9GAI6_9ZZZZ